MLEALNSLDTQIFYWINGHHNAVLDWTMWSLSQHWCWAAVIVIAFFALTIRTFRISPFSIQIERHWWIALVGIALCFLLADQGSVHLFKDTICRLRPCHALDNVRMFQTHCGGQYGFVSSHAANAFAIVTFIWLRYGKKRAQACRDEQGSVGVRNGVIVGLLMWALATCYSRPYLGKHYPGDMVCGALFGMFAGWIVWLLMNWMEKKIAHRETK